MGVNERAWDSVGAGVRLSAPTPSGDGLFHGSMGASAMARGTYRRLCFFGDGP
jgi:hypothetical protein